MKYTGKWWDSPHRSEEDRDVAAIMVRILGGLAFVLGLLMLLSCEAVDRDPIESWEVMPIELTQEQVVFTNEVVIEINEYRRSINLDTLTQYTGLPQNLATQHCNEMIFTGMISHDGFRERAEIMAQWGAEAVACNVAFGYNTPEEVVNAWIASPSHMDSLEGNYDSAAVGIREDDLGTNYITLILFR